MMNCNVEYLNNPLQLPCGVVLKNRLVKSPMSDSLADGQGNPTAEQIRLYEKWAMGGVALSIIGEVQIDYRYPEKPGNLVLDLNTNKQLFPSFITKTTVKNAHLWAQLGHAGALSHAPISQAKGPSALNIDELQCSEMTLEEIEQLPTMYAKAALIAKNIGFSGVQIHAGHGFLLSQFLSPLFNRRKDIYGVSIKNRCRIILQIISKIRQQVGPTYPIGIRINSSDKLIGGLTESDALEVIKFLNNSSIDLIDLSGGTYFPGAKSSSDSKSQDPYFLKFARQAKKISTIPLMITGGFKSRFQAINAIANNDVDMVGLARAMVLNPNLANDWLNEEGLDPQFPKFLSNPPGGMTAWYTMRITALSEDREDTFKMDLSTAIREYENRDQNRCILWRKKFLL